VCVLIFLLLLFIMNDNSYCLDESFFGTVGDRNLSQKPQAFTLDNSTGDSDVI